MLTLTIPTSNNYSSFHFSPKSSPAHHFWSFSLLKRKNRRRRRRPIAITIGWALSVRLMRKVLRRRQRKHVGERIATVERSCSPGPSSIVRREKTEKSVTAWQLLPQPASEKTKKPRCADGWEACCAVARLRLHILKWTDQRGRENCCGFWSVQKIRCHVSNYGSIFV